MGGLPSFGTWTAATASPTPGCTSCARAGRRRSSRRRCAAGSTSCSSATRRPATDFRAACDAHGALFVLNDRPDLAAAADADGVHVGQDDVPVADARATVGEERIVGLSTHSPAQIDAATGADYIACGPVHATPTKPGRPAAGLGVVAHAAAHARVPWFAIGGIDATCLAEVVTAGARRIIVVRALTHAADPEAAARALRAGLGERAPVGAA